MGVIHSHYTFFARTICFSNLENVLSCLSIDHELASRITPTGINFFQKLVYKMLIVQRNILFFELKVMTLLFYKLIFFCG